ncbi:MAG: endolytic transglycosylase MltG [Patescibacteria group bacterium]|nr:endolytic transglycosylase MltG [Patescibacteria group bacterium]
MSVRVWPQIFAYVGRWWRYEFAGVIIVIALLILIAASAPKSFPTNEIVLVNGGGTLKDISESLYQADAIRSRTFFELSVRLGGKSEDLKAGDYIFEEPLWIWTVVRRVEDGLYSINPAKVTIPEGLNLEETAELLARHLPRFDVDQFLLLAETDEGYLLPDTYFFSALVGEASVYEAMVSNFNQQVAEPLAEEVVSSGRSLEEILVMASLLEEEANNDKDRALISGVLWKRLEDGMLLQVDAVFPYIIGKNSFELTRADLKIDSPYNTYKYKGLPPGPISNPGMSSILAALRPTESPYWFYLSDMDGNMHYSRDFEEHKYYKKIYIP